MNDTGDFQSLDSNFGYYTPKSGGFFDSIDSNLDQILKRVQINSYSYILNTEYNLQLELSKTDVI